jgi:toxin ParE1/3/4
MSYTLRPQAEKDIASIALFIAADNPRAAQKWADGIQASCRRIGDMPGIGAARPEVAKGLRILPVGNYLILYVEADTGIDVLRVIHGARDQGNWM